MRRKYSKKVSIYNILFRVMCSFSNICTHLWWSIAANQNKIKTFLCKKRNKKNKQNGVQKNKIKNVFWPVTAKMTTSSQLPTKDFLTPHRF